jgi:hypothetical protein
MIVMLKVGEKIDQIRHSGGQQNHRDRANLVTGQITPIYSRNDSHIKALSL